LLFRELLKNTYPDHLDYSNIENSLLRVQEVAVYVNEKQKSSESLQKLLDIQEKLVDFPKNFTVVMPARHFLREATFVKINNHGKPQERTFFLFSDIILYCKTQIFKKVTYHFKGIVQLNCCLVKDVPDSKTVQNGFELIRLDTSNKKKCTVCTTTALEKKLWMAEIEKLIDQFLEKERTKSNSRNSQKDN